MRIIKVEYITDTYKVIIIGTLTYWNGCARSKIPPTYMFQYEEDFFKSSISYIADIWPFDKEGITISHNNLFPIFKRRLPPEDTWNGHSELDMLVLKHGWLPIDNFYFAEVYE